MAQLRKIDDDNGTVTTSARRQDDVRDLLRVTIVVALIIIGYFQFVPDDTSPQIAATTIASAE